MSLQYVALSHYNAQSHTAFSLCQTINQSSYWLADQAQTYRESQRLLKKGWIKAHPIDPDDGKRRQYFSITPEGKAALSEWIASSSGFFEEPNDEICAKLHAAYQEPRPFIHQLQRHLEFVTNSHHHLTRRLEIVGSFRPQDFVERLILEKKVIALQADMKWCENTITALEQLTTPPLMKEKVT
ncbi:helix-turn-helix transcriptional regulator [Vibrio maritimus]|uniref:helix-turn-helix transcriptional regulator n=1 Tax=Vibrio maritimus TaxID=990268 RepID=UPI004067D89D